MHKDKLVKFGRNLSIICGVPVALMCVQEDLQRQFQDVGLENFPKLEEVQENIVNTVQEGVHYFDSDVPTHVNVVPRAKL